MGKSEKSGFLLYKEQYDGISKLTIEDRGQLLTAIYQYQIQGDVSIDLSASASIAFQFIKGQFERDAQKYVDKCEKNKENALKRIRTQANASERIRTQANQADTDTDTDTENDTDNELPKGNKESTKEKKHKHGSYSNVLLTDEDYDKLKLEYPLDYAERIERLSEYIASSGKRYKSHLATIRSWAKKDKPAQKAEERCGDFDAEKAFMKALERTYGSDARCDFARCDLK